jgi:hypothetical protein
VNLWKTRSHKLSASSEGEAEKSGFAQLLHPDVWALLELPLLCEGKARGM